MNSQESFSHPDVMESVKEFKSVLKKYSINIKNNSELEKLCLLPEEIYNKHLDPSQRNENEDVRSYFRDYLGIQDLMIKILNAEKKSTYFKNLIPHLKKLNGGKPIQNSKTLSINQDNNKIFELYIACLCMDITTEEIMLDNPDHSKGNNPDIIASINGIKWGFGCKAMHSYNPKTLFDAIKKAVDQIEKSDSETGIPIIQFKNIIDHDIFWPILNKSFNEDMEVPQYLSFYNLDYPSLFMKLIVQTCQNNLLEVIHIDEINKLFFKKRSIPGCLIYIPTTTYILSQVTRLFRLELMCFGEISSKDDLIIKLMNDSLQKCKF